MRLSSRKFLVEAVTKEKKMIERKIRLLPPPRSNVVLKRRLMPQLQRRSNVVERRQRMLKSASVPRRRGVNRSRLKKSRSDSVKNTSSRG